MKIFKNINRRSITAASSLATFGLIAAACGSSTSSTNTTSSSAETSTTIAPATINVGVLPIADVAPLYIGIKEGFFAKQKLTVVPHALQGGAAVASAVVGGSLQFGYGATANLILANAHGIALRFVAAGDFAASNSTNAWSGILVNANSGITSIAGLASKTIASNALQGENELALDSVLLKNGVNPSSVHVVVLSFPTMVSALAAGQVQAVTEVEPFVASIAAHGGKLLSPLFEGEQPGMLVSGYFTSAAEISSNPGVVKRFVTAINQSLNYAAENPSAARAIIPTYSSIPSTVANNMKLPVWSSTITSSSVQGQEQLMKKLGWITSNVSNSQLVWSGANK
ncbi:ABC transporter substrate-binding protein [Acidithrix ferrooxidans]|uniref:NMT1/THI5 like protein n=1 Tax=Acidithrix ferrooxidans TaxID=1280514 RepID=A0A0D8HER4_9ACTN|nr:ABC transporter substrate-binding protein [Acidithrix ferrooxidans]KJF16408.1 NMT1/THI5 like protein [Acidithrix ferrooxidans]